MKSLKKCLLLFLLPLLGFVAVHKFYVSVTNVNYSTKDRALQITSRIFIDDLEDLLLERYEIHGRLATELELESTEAYIEKYLRQKIAFQINGEARNFDFLAKKYDNDVVICYLEVPDVDLEATQSIEIHNQLLTDLYDEQQNVVHFKINGKKKSFVLIKENYKGMLNL